ncbi:MAG: hypothetical protein D6748_04665 [Calditrichaeota bacterium]|nr:MAG: hypothetical protein D6748_04665 [Calditrichota bacterium]
MKRFVSIVLVYALLFQMTASVMAQEPGKVGKKTTIAIIDFKNTSNKSDLDYLQQAIPEALITRLAESGRLDIVERARLEDAIKEMQLSMTGIVDQSAAVEIGRAVGANAILVGSFLEIGGLIQLNARLIDVETSKVLIAKVVKGRVGTEIFNLMDELAVAIEQKLVGKAAPAKQVKKPTTPPPTPKPQPQPVAKKGGGGKGLLIVGGLLLVGGAVAAAVLLGGGGKDETPAGPTSTTVEIVVPLP